MFRFLTLFKNRDEIGKWSLAAAHGDLQPPPAFVPMTKHIDEFNIRFRDYQGAVLHSNGWVEVNATAQPLWHGIENQFIVPARQAKALRDMMALARQTGVDLVFLQIPEYQGEIERTIERQSAFRAYMQENVVGQGFKFLDFNGVLEFPRSSIELYYDVNHLNAKGSREFTQRLADTVAKECVAATVCSR